MKHAEIDLSNAVVAVTGGARGIGLATAEAFRAEGATVVIGDLDGELAAEAAEGIGAGAHGSKLDVASSKSFRAFITRAERDAGPLDILVNNAGVMPLGSFLDESEATANATIDVNVRGPINGMKLVLPGMIERGRGHVVNVASYLGKFPIPGAATYVASKHAVVGLTASVISELAGTGVSVTAVLPSAVHTELASGVAFPFERIAKVQPEEVAAAIVASCDSRPAEVSVPRWMAGYEPLSAILPGRVESLARRLLGDDRALTSMNHSERAAYAERLQRQNS